MNPESRELHARFREGVARASLAQGAFAHPGLRSLTWAEVARVGRAAPIPTRVQVASKAAEGAPPSLAGAERSLRCDCARVQQELRREVHEKCALEECLSKFLGWTTVITFRGEARCAAEYNCSIGKDNDHKGDDADCDEKDVVRHATTSKRCGLSLDVPELPLPGDDTDEEQDEESDSDDCGPLRADCTEPGARLAPEPDTGAARRQVDVEIASRWMDSDRGPFDFEGSICGVSASTLRRMARRAWGYVLANSDLADVAMCRTFWYLGGEGGDWQGFPAFCYEGKRVPSGESFNEYLATVRGAVGDFLFHGTSFHVGIGLSPAAGRNCRNEDKAGWWSEHDPPTTIHLSAGTGLFLNLAGAAPARSDRQLTNLLDLAGTFLHELIHASDPGLCLSDDPNPLGEADVSTLPEEIRNCLPQFRAAALFRSLLHERYGV